MPKRRNPFGDSSPLQFKTHVGQKELNEGVDGERSLKGIYEKTKQILFSGAQRSASDMVTDANDNHVVFTPVGSPVRRCTQLPPLPGQLCLNQSGQLTVPTRDVDMDAAPISENSWNFLKGNPHCHLYNECSPPHNVHQMAPLPGQLRLDQSGQLMVPTTSSKDVDMVAVPSLQETWNKVKGKGKQPLKKFPLQEKCRCSFCDKWIDRRSIRQCTNCDEDFCEVCSTVNYDECMERIFCLGCNS